MTETDHSLDEVGCQPTVTDGLPPTAVGVIVEAVDARADGGAPRTCPGEATVATQAFAATVAHASIAALEPLALRCAVSYPQAG